MLRRISNYLRKPEVVDNSEVKDYSPDFWRMEQFTKQFIFVCGDMMTNGDNNWMVAEACVNRVPEYPGHVYTDDLFTFWKKDLGINSYPIILPNNYRPTGFVRWPVEPLPIKGELWGIIPYQFKKVLDEHHQNGVVFRRERIRIRLPIIEIGWTARTSNPTSDEKIPLPKMHERYNTCMAWAYIGIPEYWDNQIGGIFARSQLSPCENDIPRKYVGKFYRFDNEDNNN